MLAHESQALGLVHVALNNVELRARSAKRSWLREEGERVVKRAPAAQRSREQRAERDVVSPNSMLAPPASAPRAPLQPRQHGPTRKDWVMFCCTAMSSDRCSTNCWTTGRRAGDWCCSMVLSSRCDTDWVVFGLAVKSLKISLLMELEVGDGVVELDAEAQIKTSRVASASATTSGEWLAWPCSTTYSS